MGILGNYISVRGGTMRNLYGLMRSTRAATAVEYGLILALIFLAAVSTITEVGNSTTTMWDKVSTSATNVM
tara:strand:+ start:95 stop:307 length:213 start_codon:yes stop_codon:yes gene_type:complete